MPSEIDLPVYWDKKYQRNEANWDLKSANHVFEELMEKEDILRPGKLLIPGCGNGFDAIAAAKRGFEVTAIDFSVEAINFGKNLAEKENVNVNFLTEDFFKLDEKFENYFDSIYEYTTYCAINPERRDEFARKISTLLKPDGKYLTILFPVEDRAGGPPFGINPVEAHKIFSKYLKLSFFTKEVNSIKPRKNREVIQLYIK
jgi:SAM-dependent methyltransferase